MSDIQTLRKIVEKNPRYPVEAYLFVLEALFCTRKKFKKEKHVSGQELLEGIKDLALNRYGSTAKMVFNHWGIKKTVDLGDIVFNMVNAKLLSKTEEDSLDDFKDVYNFEDVFIKDYQFEIKVLKNGNK
ncbi:MAG: hypothetical protein E3J47_01140 [Candidatus Stahlbacteria bacterium]|nr:MAG: hypothetical protein E3J47_01140 [Candidatus Stahlbacteria bacterium]